VVVRAARAHELVPVALPFRRCIFSGTVVIVVDDEGGAPEVVDVQLRDSVVHTSARLRASTIANTVVGPRCHVAGCSWVDGVAPGAKAGSKTHEPFGVGHPMAVGEARCGGGGGRGGVCALDVHTPWPGRPAER
jgi:hypothetical protein